MKPYRHRANVVCPLVSEKNGSSGDPGIQLPTTVAISTPPAPISDASMTRPLRILYMYRPTNRAIGMVQKIVNVPHDDPGTGSTVPAGRVTRFRSSGTSVVSAGT